MKTRSKWPIVLGAVAFVIVAGVVVASFILDGILTSQAQAQAQKLSLQLGRPVVINRWPRKS